MTDEVLAITQEECAEVVQAISKVMRFGLEGEYNGTTNKSRLEEEVGDLMCMLQLLEEKGYVDWSLVSLHAARKKEKLKKWSNIFN